MIYGNKKGIKRTILDRLEELGGFYDKHCVIEESIVDIISEISCQINREICVYLSRAGQIIAVGLGDAGTVAAAGITLKRSVEVLSGTRCFHTHINASAMPSKQDLVVLHHDRLDCIGAIECVGGKAKAISISYIEANGESDTVFFNRYSDIDHDEVFERIRFSDELLAKPVAIKTVKDAKRAILVATNEEDIKELKSLASTAGLNTVFGVTQNKAVPDKAYYVGKGKLDQIRSAVLEHKADIAVFDAELSGRQLNNIEQVLKIKIIDRAMLILEIFARHASSNEGKLQVELARLKISLPKLLGHGIDYSRIGGGGGAGAATKGSGEKKLETDRRHVKRQVVELTQKIEKLKANRDLRRKERNKGNIKSIAVVGYTNAGKSTLMNALAKAGVKAEDKLFATLDPVTRRVSYGTHEFLLTDTVGFIDRLPHELIEAFRSTLEEAKYADILMHVVDFSSPASFKQYDIAEEVLESLGAGGKPTIIVYNKIDKAEIDPSTAAVPRLVDAVFVSAKTGKGMDELRDKIVEVVTNSEK